MSRDPTQIQQTGITREAQRLPGLTPKAIAIGMAGIVFQGAHGMRSFSRVQGTELDGAFYYTMFSIFYVIVFMAIAALVMKYTKQRILTHQELAVIFAINAMGNLGMGNMTHYGFGIMTSLPALVYQTPEWAPWLDNVSSLVFPRAEDVGQAFFDGGAAPIGAWIGPVLFWTFFWSLTVVMLFFLGVMLRRRWSDIEGYQFPTVTPPIAIMQPAEDGYPLGKIWNSRMAWIGVMVGAAYIVMNEMWRIYPIYDPIPWLPVTQISGANLYWTWSPAVIGVAYMIVNTQILFSLWFAHYFFRKLPKYIFAETGMSEISPSWSQAGTDEQLLGAAILLTVVTLYMSRNEVKLFLSKALNPAASDYDDGGEPVSYQLAFWGLVTAAVLKIVLAWAFLNTAIHFSIIMVLFVICMGTALGRARCQGGWFNQHNLRSRGLDERIFYSLMGTNGVGGPQGQFYGRLAWGLETRGHQNIALAYTLDMMKVADATNTKRRDMGKAVLLGMVGIIFFTLFTGIYVVHNWGGAEVIDRWPLTTHYNTDLMNDDDAAFIPALSDPWRLFWIGVGVSIAGFLNFMFVNFVWWPLHPIGYLAAMTSHALRPLFFPIFIAWAIKVMVMRYGGTRIDAQIRQFFIGVLVGYAFLKGFYATLSFFVEVQSGWYY